MPGIEDSLNRTVQLCVHVLRKLLAVLAYDRFETIHERLPGCGIDFGVGSYTERGAGSLDQLFETTLINAEYHV